MKYHERAKQIFQVQDLKPLHRLVMLAVSDHTNDYGVAYPSIGRLAKFTGLSDRSVQRVLKDLETSGRLVRIPRDGNSTLYQIGWGGVTAEDEGVTPVVEGVTGMDEGVTISHPNGSNGSNDQVTDAEEPQPAPKPPAYWNDILAAYVATGRSSTITWDAWGKVLAPAVARHGQDAVVRVVRWACLSPDGAWWRNTLQGTKLLAGLLRDDLKKTLTTLVAQTEGLTFDVPAPDAPHAKDPNRWTNDIRYGTAMAVAHSWEWACSRGDPLALPVERRGPAPTGDAAYLATVEFLAGQFRSDVPYAARRAQHEHFADAYVDIMDRLEGWPS